MGQILHGSATGDARYQSAHTAIGSFDRAVKSGAWDQP